MLERVGIIIYNYCRSDSELSEITSIPASASLSNFVDGTYETKQSLEKLQVFFI